LEWTLTFLLCLFLALAFSLIWLVLRWAAFICLLRSFLACSSERQEHREDWLPCGTLWWCHLISWLRVFLIPTHCEIPI
jgi:hypothetical protein